jgi:hypothetical protein
MMEILFHREKSNGCFNNFVIFDPLKLSASHGTLPQLVLLEQQLSEETIIYITRNKINCKSEEQKSDPKTDLRNEDQINQKQARIIFKNESLTQTYDARL